MRENIIILKNLAFFQTMKQDFLELVLLGAKRVKFSNGQCLFKQGQLIDYATVIVSGSIKLHSYCPKAEKEKLLDIVTVGTLLNDICMVRPVRAPFTAIANTDSLVLQISHKYFLKMLEDFPELAYYIYHYFSQRMQYFIQNLSA